MARRARQRWLRIHSTFSTVCMFDPASQFFPKLLLRAVKDWVLCILNIKIEYFVCRFLGHVVLILLLDLIYENILSLTSI